MSKKQPSATLRWQPYVARIYAFACISSYGVALEYVGWGKFSQGFTQLFGFFNFGEIFAQLLLIFAWCVLILQSSNDLAHYD